MCSAENWRWSKLEERSRKSKELRNRTRTAEPLESVALRRDLLVREHLHLEAEHRLRDAHDLCASDHTKDLISGAEVQ